VTGGRGLQPAMDHVLENEGKPVPDLASAAEEPARPAASAGADAMDVDADDDEAEALRAALKLSKGEGSAAGAEDAEGADAKVCGAASCVQSVQRLTVVRASCALSVRKYFATRTRPTSMLSSPDTTNSKSRRRRYGYLSHSTHLFHIGHHLVLYNTDRLCRKSRLPRKRRSRSWPSCARRWRPNVR
jgi:hypothetical protein